VSFRLPLSARLLPLLALITLVVAVATAEAGAATKGCAAFPTQAAAQDYFLASGGGPQQRVGTLDGNRDGVACEGLPGPFKGYATLGYNRKQNFFYGTASMPPLPGASGFPCMEGNPAFPDGPRRLNVYRTMPGADQLVLGPVGAEARLSSGRLVWKADKAVVPDGRYYAAFEEKIRMTPYGGNECPGFRSAEIALPQPLSR
jgi:hypothetical protein